MNAVFEPQHVDYKTKVMASFERQQAMKTIGASILDVRPGEVELELPYQERLNQQHGFLHGGIVCTMLDCACGYAAFSLMPEDAAILTIECKTNMLSPAKGEKFLAFGRVKKPGRNITVVDGELYAFVDGQKKLVAVMLATMMAIFGREGIEN